MPSFVVWAVAAIGAAVGGAAGAMMIMYAAEIAAGAMLLGGLALSSAQSRKAQRKAREAYNASQVDRMLNVVTTIGQRELVMGRVRKAGTVFFRGSTGTNKETFVMLIALAGHEIDAVEEIYLNEDLVTLDVDGYVTSAPYSLEVKSTHTESFSGTSITLAAAPVADSVTVTATEGTGETATTSIIAHTLVGSVVTVADTGVYTVTYQSTSSPSKARIRWYLGTADQTADARVMELFPGTWTSDHRAQGVAYLVCEFTYDESAYPSGLPAVSAVIRGAKLYDPRDESTTWSENPALMARHLLTHAAFGKRAVLTAAEDARIAVAANACDTSHGYVVDGVTDTRALFTAGYVVPYGAPAKDALDDVCQAMGGMWAYAGGEFFIRAGVYTASVLSLTEADLAVVKRTSDGSVQQQPVVIGTHMARADKVNTITPRIWEEEQGYKQVALTPLVGAALLARDGVVLAREVDMPAVTYAPQALHVAGVIMRDERDPLRVTLPFKLRAYPVELFDSIDLTLVRYGWSAKVFTVLGRSWTLDGLLQLTLKETAAAIYQPDAAFDPQGYAPNTDLPRPWDIEPPTITSITSGASELLLQADGTIVPRVKVAWDAITDRSLVVGGQVEVRYRVDLTADWHTTSVPASETFVYITDVREGDVIFIQARTRNAVAVSDWTVQMVHTVAGKTTAPLAFDVFSMMELDNGAREYTFAYTSTPLPADWRGAEIRYIAGTYVTPDWSAMTPLASEGTYFTHSPVETVTPTTPGTYTFACRARDGSGGLSTMSVVTATFVVDPMDIGGPVVSLRAEGRVAFVNLQNGGGLTPASITLTATVVNMVSPTYAWKVDGVLQVGEVASTFVLAAFTGTAKQVRCDVTSGTVTAYDTFSIYSLSEGDDAIQAGLTNEHQTISVDAGGTATAGQLPAASAMVVVQGAAILSSGVVYGVASTTSCTASINASTGVISVTAIAADAASATFRATVTASSTVLDRVMTLNKSYPGAAGAPGGDGSDGARGSLKGYGSQYSISSSSWSDAKANRVINNMLTGGVLTTDLATTGHLRIGDTVQLTNSTSFVQSKFWSGSAWTTAASVIEGNLLVNGSGTFTGDITGASNINITGQAIIEGNVTYGGVNAAVHVNFAKASTFGISAKCPDNASGVAIFGTNVGGGVGVEGQVSGGAGGAGLHGGASGAGNVAVKAIAASGAAALAVDGAMTMTSTLQVDNLNANYLQGFLASAFSQTSHNHSGVYLPAGGTAADSTNLGGYGSGLYPRYTGTLTAGDPGAPTHTVTVMIGATAVRLHVSIP